MGDAGDHQATFSRIRFGPIGTTLPSYPPAPTPTPTPNPAPAPTPPPTPLAPSPVPTPIPTPAGGCCSWATPDEVQECGNGTDYCMANAGNCVECNGHWIRPDTQLVV